MQYPAVMQPTRARMEQLAPEDEAEHAKSSTIFSAVPLRMSRNFTVLDTTMESGGIAAAESQPADFLTRFNGLEAVSSDIKDLLPPECRQAFEGALSKEKEWRSRWGFEVDVMSRHKPVIDKAIVPYNMP